MNEKNLVAVLPNRTEYFETVHIVPGNLCDDQYRQVAEHAVRDAKMTTPRHKPQKVTVSVSVLVIEKGRLHRYPHASFDIQPPLESMDKEQYEEEMKAILILLPAPFHLFVRRLAWDEGHAAGYEEVVNIAINITNALLNPIAEYRSNLLASYG